MPYSTVQFRMILSNLLNFHRYSLAWHNAPAELFVVIEFHMAHDGSNLSGISPGDTLK